jgi:integrase
MRDLNALKLANLFPMEISEPRGAEFFVHLSKTPITYPERTHMCRTLMAALGERKVLAKHDPRRYRRTFATYMAGLSLLDRLLGHR